MLHPSYTEIMAAVNSNVEEGNEPVVNSRYSIVIASAKRARQIIDAQKNEELPLIIQKPLSTAVEEIYSGAVKILSEEEAAALEAEEADMAAAYEEVLAGEEAPEEEEAYEAEEDTEETEA